MDRSERGRRGARWATDAGRVALVLVAAGAAVASGGLDGLLLASAAGAVATRWLRLPPMDDVAVVGALALTGFSSAFKLYGWFAAYDSVVHYTFFVLTTPAFFRLLTRLGGAARLDGSAARRAKPAVVLIMVAIALAAGAVWEMIEWASDSFAGTNFQHGNADTMLDLVVDGLGGLTAGLVWSWWSPPAATVTDPLHRDVRPGRRGTSSGKQR